MARPLLHSASRDDAQQVTLPSGVSVYFEPDANYGHLERLRNADPDQMSDDELAERGAFLQHEMRRQALIRAGQMGGDPDAGAYSEGIDNSRAGYGDRTSSRSASVPAGPGGRSVPAGVLASQGEGHPRQSAYRTRCVVVQL